MVQWATKSNLKKLRSLKKRYTVRELYHKTAEKLSAPYRDYETRYQDYLPSEAELKQQRENAEEGPKFSIVVPAFETDEGYLCQMIDSVCGQTYGSWELCITDGSKTDKVSSIIEQYYKEETRIRYHRLKENRGISENTNEGFQIAEGAYIGLLDHDDTLVPSALYEMAKRIKETGADMLYSDEDKISADGEVHSDPHFKRDFNRELLLGNNYICHFLVVSRQLLERTGPLRAEYDGAQDFDFVLRCSEKAERIEHIGKILYHWRIHPGSTAGDVESKRYAYEAGKKAIKAYLKRNSWCGTVYMQKDLGFYQTRYEVKPGIRVGVYLWGKPSRQFSGIWKMLSQELRQYGCIVQKMKEKGGNYDKILVINRGITVYTKQSAVILLGNCSRTGIGITGAKTLYKKKVIQCGYIWSDEEFKPQCAGLPAEFKGYFRRAFLAAEVDAVASQLAVTGMKAWKLGKEMDFKPENEESWRQWCLSVKKAGLAVIVEPQACIQMD